MKKYIALIITLAIIASLFAGCGKKADGVNIPAAGTPAPTQGAEDPKAEVTPTPVPTKPTMPLDMEAFLREIAKANPEGDLEKIEADIIKNPFFVLYTREYTEWYYPGMVWDFKPQGVKDVLCISDNVSKKGSLVYVIIPEEGTDPETIAESLKANSDPKWMDFEKGTDGMVSFAENGILYFSMYDTQMEPVTGTIAEKARDLVTVFHEYLASHPDATMLELAEYFVRHQKFNSIYAEEATADRLTGLTDYSGECTIKGFTEAAGIKPFMSPNLFIGYVFRLDDSTDKDAFVKSLEDNANLAWNICMVANTVIIETDGNAVLFMMCSEPKDEE